MTDVVPTLSADSVRQTIAQSLLPDEYHGKRVLLIIPDATRTAPLPLLFDAVYQTLRSSVKQLDVLVALGTHPPMSEVQICEMLGIKPMERGRLFLSMQFFNHEWDNPEQLVQVGTLSKAETHEISGGLLEEDVPVTINKLVLDYDTLLVLGPVFPHEVVGFSGGNKYFFPGIAGQEILNFFHWLGALITNVGIIGLKYTPVRAVVDRAAAMIPSARRCLTFVVAKDGNLHGLFYGTPEAAWNQAADLSSQVHIKWVEKPFQQVLSCAPLMYDELWVAGKCMYKLEPVVADGGELIIYAPHLERISITHGELIEQIGYHCRAYFTEQWDRFQDFPRGVLAHSTHVRGTGTFENGVEKCRVRVTLASQVPQEICEKINLGYRDPKSIDIESFANREAEGVLLVRKAGEMLYRLNREREA
jgi:nickel-dependent lactate racemase